MCLSCHDGAVLDSRDKICNDPGHRVGNIPSQRVRIPENFPLDENDAMQCSTCHTPHAVKKTKDRLVEFFLRAPNKDSSLCIQCHGSSLGDEKNGNHPLNAAVGTIPPAIREAGGIFGGTANNGIICETCHVSHGGINNQLLVLSVEDPQTRSVLCEACHTRNPGRTKDPAREQFSHPLDLVPADATPLPELWPDGKKVFLGKRGELVCRTCHVPHGASSPEHLLVERNENGAICIHCHQQQASVKGSKHDLTAVNVSFTTVPGQTPAAGGVCSACHVAHGAMSSRYLWANPFRPPIPAHWQDGNDIATQNMVLFCTGCHSAGNSSGRPLPPFGFHPPAVFPQGSTSPVCKDLPLFTPDGEVSAQGNIVCSTCHNPHQWKGTADGNASGPAGEGTVSDSFLRPGIPEALCAPCHGEDGLVRFLYFHRSQRTTKKVSFPQLKRTR
jgi:predicted CXXCH cytochrome family protein